MTAAPSLSRSSTVKDSLTVGMLTTATSKAPTGRPSDNPGHRPRSNASIESGALKGRNNGGAA